MSDQLKLRAQDADDLTVISAMVQDALVPLADMAWLQDERRFVVALNRYRWNDTGAATRTHALLHIHHVTGVQTRGLNRRERDRILELLTLSFDDGAVHAAFAGGGSLRVAVEGLDCALEDVGEPWPAGAVPTHEGTDEQ